MMIESKERAILVFSKKQQQQQNRADYGWKLSFQPSSIIAALEVASRVEMNAKKRRP